MSSKIELQRKVNEIGYELGPFASKETLLNIIRLHSIVVTDKDINVAELNDLELRKRLTQHGLLVGPVTNHTRSIYQRKLLEILTNQICEGEQEDEYEIDDSIVPNQDDFNEQNTVYPGLFSTKSNSYSSRQNNEPTIMRHAYGNSNAIRSRKDLEPVKINKDSTSKKVVIDDKFEKPKVNNNIKQQVATKSGGIFLYAGITIGVALIVFVLYLCFEK